MITLLSTVGKTFCRILNDRMGAMMEKEEKTSAGRAGFRPDRSCAGHVYALGKIIQGRKDAGLTTNFFLDVQKACGTVWRNGLWEKMWEIGMRAKGGYSFVACLSLLTIDHASLSRRSTVPTVSYTHLTLPTICSV